jgi:pyruvate-formate lyase-activating enzyme/glutaredoxin
MNEDKYITFRRALKMTRAPEVGCAPEHGDITMTYQIYTATGCGRCNITKQFMRKNGIHFEEYDVKAEGKQAFAQFYRANRESIYRDVDGVEFPVLTDGKVIRQGAGVVIGHLISGDHLCGFIGRSRLHGEWIDGFSVSGGNPKYTEDLLRVLAHFKQKKIKIQLTTNGFNAVVLQAILEKQLGDRVVMEVKGPAPLYRCLTGRDIEEDELKQSIALASRFPEILFYTTVAPLTDDQGQTRYLTPNEIDATARMIEVATGSNRHPYELRQFPVRQTEDQQLKRIEPLPSGALFRYRTAARRYLIMTEIAK